MDAKAEVKEEATPAKPTRGRLRAQEQAKASPGPEGPHRSPATSATRKAGRWPASRCKSTIRQPGPSRRRIRIRGHRPRGHVRPPGLPRRPLQINLTRPAFDPRTEDLPADRDQVEWTFCLVPDPRDNDQPAPVTDEPIPPGLRDRLTFVDLDPRGTDYLADGPGYAGNDLNRLPRGIHKLGETYFRIGEKMVHVQGRMRPDLPQSVKGIKVQARGDRLHFLHATQCGADVGGNLIGAYVVHYADGTSERIPIVYGRNLVELVELRGSRARSRPGPRSPGPARTTRTEHRTRASMSACSTMTWTNPHPEKEIATLDVLSAGKECDPFLVAVTVERDR